MQSSGLKNWLPPLAAATALVVIFATHGYLYAIWRGQATSELSILFWAMSEWYTWAALFPFILSFTRKHPIESPRIGKALLANAGATIVFSLVHLFALTLVRYGGRPFSEIFLQPTNIAVHLNLATGTIIVCCSHALEYYRRYREREIRASQLEVKLAQAQLQALRMQIHPHFLFNALNSVSALIDEDPKAAHQMLARLGDFLRLTLKNTGAQATSLEQELLFLKSYLQIEQVRFGDRLKVSIDVDPTALNATVPSLILQPIVENAFRHALSKVETGSLDIRGRKRGDLLEITVADNGPGVQADAAAQTEGVGLANTRARLQTQYGTAHSLLLENGPQGGLVVTIKIPYQAGAAKWN